MEKLKIRNLLLALFVSEIAFFLLGQISDSELLGDLSGYLVIAMIVVESIIYYDLKDLNVHYKKAAIINLAKIVLQAIAYYLVLTGVIDSLSINSDDIYVLGETFFAMLRITYSLLVAELVIELLVNREAFKGHSELCNNYGEYELAQKWQKLFKYNVYVSIGLVLMMVFAFINLGIMALIGLVASIASIVVSILGLVYLYKTMKIFDRVDYEDYNL